MLDRVCENANDVNIAIAGVLTQLSNEGGGAEIYDEGTSNALRTLYGTTNGIVVTQNATDITIDNTLSATNIGTGAGTVFDSKVGSNLQFCY